MARAQLEQHLEDLMRGKRHGDSAIFAKIADGSATREQIAWAGLCYCYFAAGGQKFLGSMLSHCPPSDTQGMHIIVDVIIDEFTSYRCGDRAHYLMFVEFLNRFAGLPVEDIEAYGVPPNLRRLSAIELRMAEELPPKGCMGIAGYAGESPIPEAFSRLSAGLRAHYGVKDEDQEAWILHIGADLEHGDKGRELLLQYADSAEKQAKVEELLCEYRDAFFEFWQGTLQPPRRFLDLLAEKGRADWVRPSRMQA